MSVLWVAMERADNQKALEMRIVYDGPQKLDQWFRYNTKGSIWENQKENIAIVLKQKSA